MRHYEFTIILSADPSEDETEAVGEYVSTEGQGFADGVLVVLLGQTSGVPYAACTVEADSLDEALRKVLRPLRDRGLAIERVEVSSDSLAFLEVKAA